MIQLILKVFKIFCGLGGPYVAPFFAPIAMLIMPPQLISCWIVLLMCIFWPIMASEPGMLNSSDGKNKDSNLAFRNAFFIYYIIMCLCTFAVLTAVCKARSAVPF